jgi:hypothetical protein
MKKMNNDEKVINECLNFLNKTLDYRLNNENATLDVANIVNVIKDSAMKLNKNKLNKEIKNYLITELKFKEEKIERNLYWENILYKPYRKETSIAIILGENLIVKLIPSIPGVTLFDLNDINFDLDVKEVVVDKIIFDYQVDSLDEVIALIKILKLEE